MVKRIGIGGSDFGELVREDLLFVDKSLFVKEILDDKTKVTIITRPRRWGKTLNLSMLHYFLASEVHGQKTAGLFDKLLIAKEPENYIQKHQGQYPVIFITLKDVKKSNLKEILDAVNLLIQEVYGQHDYLLNSQAVAEYEKRFIQKALNQSLNQAELEASLKTLSKLLYQHHKQYVYILMDEYDTPLNFARSQEAFDNILTFMKNFLSNTFKGNDFLRKGVITGILRISKDSMLSGLNNPKIHTMLEGQYHPYFGFTDAELDALFAEQQLTKDEAAVKAWYNGYCLNGLTLYNPWSIMNSLDDGGMIKPYWLNTGDDSLLKELLQQADEDVKAKFKSLALGETVKTWVSPTMRFDQVRTSTTMLWNLLVSAGYLKVLSSKLRIEGFYDCELAIPNHEVMGLYKLIFLEWLTSLDKVGQLTVSLELIAQGRVKDFEQAIERFLKMAASVHDYAHQPEAFYQGFMLALCVALVEKYYVFSNHESGLGRPDLIIIPKDTQASQAVVLEFKTVTGAETLQARAQEGLNQIQQKEYASIIHQYSHIKTILLVGMSFDGKTVCCLQSETT